MTVLREALVSCSLTQAALLSAVQQPDRSSAGEALAEQAILDGVVSLLNAGVFRSLPLFTYFRGIQRSPEPVLDDEAH